MLAFTLNITGDALCGLRLPSTDAAGSTNHLACRPKLHHIQVKKEFGKLIGVVWGEGRSGREGRAGEERGAFLGERDFEGNYNHTK
jgi:hypothetical protein